MGSNCTLKAKKKKKCHLTLKREMIRCAHLWGNSLIQTYIKFYKFNGAKVDFRTKSRTIYKRKRKMSKLLLFEWLMFGMCI